MRLRLCLLAATVAVAVPAFAQAVVEKPAALVADGIPAVPRDMAERTRPYMEFRTASFQSWNPATKGIGIITRFGNVPQVHEVARPGAARRQVSFEADTISGAAYSRGVGDVAVVQKDVGGNEFWQLYSLANGRLELLTDGKSRNSMNAWSHDGKWLAYTSTRRNGTDNDIYVIDPRRPKSDRLVAQVKGGGWGVADFAPDGRSAVAVKYNSVNDADLYRLDIFSGRMTPIGDHAQRISYGGVRYAPNGTLWVTSDEGSDFRRLGTLDPASGRFTPVAPEPRWDVESFDIAHDGSFIAYTVNEAGISRLKVMDHRTCRVR